MLVVLGPISTSAETGAKHRLRSGLSGGLSFGAMGFPGGGVRGFVMRKRNCFLAPASLVPAGRQASARFVSGLASLRHFCLPAWRFRSRPKNTSSSISSSPEKSSVSALNPSANDTCRWLPKSQVPKICC